MGQGGQVSTLLGCKENNRTGTTMATSKSSQQTNHHQLSQWANRVTAYSSQYNSDSWSANQVIGAPKVYPNYGDKHGAWASQDINAHQFVEIEFVKPVYATGIDIYETYHAGGVKRVLARNTETQKWVTLWQTDTVRKITSSRVFSPEFQPPLFQTRELRIEVDCTACNSWVELDAIQLHGNEFRTAPPPSMEKYAMDFAKLVNSQNFSDVQFLVEGKIVYGHRNILSVRSDYFNAMFSINMKESQNTKPIEIKNVKYDSFLLIMHYLYTNKLPTDYGCIKMTDVWRAADQFSMEGLRTMATSTIVGQIDTSNVVEVYVLATSSLPIIDDLKNNCLAYMSSHISEIVNSPSFVDLPQETMLEIIQLTTARLNINK